MVCRTDPLHGFEDSIQHRLRETAGLRVPLARMVGCDQRDRRQGPDPLMSKLRHRRGNVVTRCAPRAQERLHRHGPEDDDHPEVPQEHHFAFQVGLASSELDSRRLVLRRGAPHRGGGVAIPGDEAVVFRNGRCLIRKARPVQRPIQEFSAPGSRECAPGAVATMGRRRPPAHGEGIIVSKSRPVRFSRVVALSQAVGPETQMFPAYPPPSFTQWTTREVHGFFAESMFLISHTGTHVDAPFHFEPKGRKLDELPVDRFIAPGHVLDLRGLPKKGRILPQHLRTSMSATHRSVGKGDAILLRTRWWERHRGTPAYLFDSPGLTGAGANFLLKLGVSFVGIDTASIDHPEDATYPAHHALLGANVLVIENVANLSALGSSAFWLLALPLNLQGTSGSPIRLVALGE